MSIAIALSKAYSCISCRVICMWSRLCKLHWSEKRRGRYLTTDNFPLACESLGIDFRKGMSAPHILSNLDGSTTLATPVELCGSKSSTSTEQNYTETRLTSFARQTRLKMHLMYTLDGDGKRVYTLKKIVDGEVTKSAHPARFSPDDKYSR